MPRVRVCDMRFGSSDMRSRGRLFVCLSGRGASWERCEMGWAHWGWWCHCHLVCGLGRDEDRWLLYSWNYWSEVVIIRSILRMGNSKAMGSNSRCWNELSRVEGHRKLILGWTKLIGFRGSTTRLVVKTTDAISEPPCGSFRHTKCSETKRQLRNECSKIMAIQKTAFYCTFFNSSNQLADSKV